MFLSGHRHSHAIPAHMLKDDESSTISRKSAHSRRGSQAEPHNQVETGSSSSANCGFDNPAFANDQAEGARVPDSHPDLREDDWSELHWRRFTHFCHHHCHLLRVLIRDFFPASIKMATVVGRMCATSPVQL